MHLISWTLIGWGKGKAGIPSATPLSVVPFCAILGQQYSPEPVCLLRLLNTVNPSTGFIWECGVPPSSHNSWGELDSASIKNQGPLSERNLVFAAPLKVQHVSSVNSMNDGGHVARLGLWWISEAQFYFYSKWRGVGEHVFTSYVCEIEEYNFTPELFGCVY